MENQKLDNKLLVAKALGLSDFKEVYDHDLFLMIKDQKTDQGKLNLNLIIKMKKDSSLSNLKYFYGLGQIEELIETTSSGVEPFCFVMDDRNSRGSFKNNKGSYVMSQLWLVAELCYYAGVNLNESIGIIVGGGVENNVFSRKRLEGVLKVSDLRKNIISPYTFQKMGQYSVFIQNSLGMLECFGDIE